MNADTYRDAFMKFLAQGMTYAEAFDEFSPLEWQRAAMQEVVDDEAIIEPLTHEFVTNDERRLPTLFALSCRAMRQQQDVKDMEQAYELWGAGWTHEVPEPFQHNYKDFWRQCPVMSWHWRAPSKRLGKPGRRYFSTQQAFNAMQRAHERKAR